MQRTLAKDTTNQVDKKVKLQGWVNTVRSHGKIIFVDLRDRSDIVQVVFADKLAKNAKTLHDEYVIEVVGTVKKRPDSMINPNLETGTVEIEAESLEILNSCETPPFDISTDTSNVDEPLRMKYRYLDLRSQRLNRNIKLRSEFVEKARRYFFKNDFVEIETPILTKSTPEGSRDFVVPSRLNPGKFYALPQSPQQYKQLLMTAGFERYFQIARAIRDEDPRADRGYEHTQIDLEMSFVKMEDVMNTVEEMIIEVVESMGFKIKEKPFPRITYKEAMEKFGADKFDLRTEEEKEKGILAYAWVVEFPFFEKTDEGDYTFSHNPFSMPIDEHVEWLLEGKNVEQILTTQYDLVCNGYESGGGSIRAHRPEILRATYKVMGYSDEEIEESVGHMLEAFKYGTPPHGGIALGVERNVMNLTGEKFIREVQAFPMTGKGNTAVMDAPSKLTQKQLDELSIIAVDNVYERIRQLAKRLDIKYTEYHHEPVRTSEEAAKVRGVPLHVGAKALIMLADKKPIQVVVPGDKKVNTDAVKNELGVSKLKMAPKELAEQLSGVEIGGIPPFGNLFDNSIDVFVSKSVLENEFMEFNAGSRSISMRMNPNDWFKMTNATVGDYDM